MKTTIIVLVIVLLAVGGYFAFRPHAVVAPEYSVSPSASPSPSASATPAPIGTRPPATATPTPTPGLQVNVTNVVKVAISGFQFSPAQVTVHRGDVVAFTNDDQVTHTVTSDTGAFTGGTVAPGSELTVATADLAAGTYAYHCSIHPSMHGTIVVQ